MKKLTQLSVIGISILCFLSPIFAEDDKMVGLTALPSFDGPGLGARVWQSESWGWGLEAKTDWEFNALIGRARLMYTLSTGDENRWYGLLTGGYRRTDESSGGYSATISYPTAAFGLGYEKLIGEEANKGLGFEVGYQVGRAEYTLSGPSFTLERTSKVFPVYIGLSFTIYFK